MNLLNLLAEMHEASAKVGQLKRDQDKKVR
jgi:hypothetical protein